MTPPRLRRRERVLLALTLALILVCLVYAAVLEPVALDWLALHRRAEAAVMELTKLRALVGSQEKIAEAHTRVAESVLRSASAEEAQLLLFNEVSRLTGENGIELDGLRPVRVAEESGLTRYGVDLNGRCAPPALMDLLLAMQSPEHLLRVDKLTVVAGRGKPPLTLTMRVSKLAQVERNN